VLDARLARRPVRSDQLAAKQLTVTSPAAWPSPGDIQLRHSRRGQARWLRTFALPQSGYRSEPAAIRDSAAAFIKTPQVSDRVWLVTFMHYDGGCFDDEMCRLEPIDNPFGPKVLPMCPE
jgi:hypothetical protein